MKFDIYKIGNAAKVYARGEVSDCGELPYDVKPLYECDDYSEAYDWCDERADRHDDDAIRTYNLTCAVSAAFVEDALKRAKEHMKVYREDGKELGFGELVINHDYGDSTYRASAAWKDYPTYYTFAQSVKWSDKSPALPANERELFHRDVFVRLKGMATALYELGFILVFTDDFELHLFGRNEYWKREED